MVLKTPDIQFICKEYIYNNFHWFVSTSRGEALYKLITVVYHNSYFKNCDFNVVHTEVQNAYRNYVIQYLSSVNCFDYRQLDLPLD